MATRKSDKTPNRKTSKSHTKAPDSSLLDQAAKLWSELTGSDKHQDEDTQDDMTQGEIIRFALGSLLFIISCFLILSLVSFLINGADDDTWTESPLSPQPANWMGTWGLSSARYFIKDCWGVPSLLIPLFTMMASLRIMKVYKVRLWKWFLNCSFLMVWLSAFGSYCLQGLLEALHSHISAGGAIGAKEIQLLRETTGPLGTFGIMLVTAIAYLAYLSDETIRIIRKILYPKELISKVSAMTAKSTTADGYDKSDKPSGYDIAEHEDTIVIDEEPLTTDEAHLEDIPDPEDRPAVTDEPDFIVTTTQEETTPADTPDLKVVHSKAEELAQLDDTKALEPYDPKLDLENYHYPTIDLLKHYDVDTTVDMEEQQKNKNRIIQVLQDFGVKISSIKATVGPTITLYEITPAPGVRISRIRNLEDDIALSLSALGIRIIAPIPGKGTIGIEVPNARPQVVSMESIINSRKFQDTTFELPMALGKTITNEIFMVDLAKMPHLLVAGATGQGKSVGLNAIITSLLYKKHPAELKLVMVDPKKVEFSVYSPIVNHFLAQVEGNEDDEPIITDVQKVVQTLKSLCVEMDNRYLLLKSAGVRNIKEYNEMFKNRRLNPEKGHHFMPYIVVVIDEFGDLIMTAGKEIELPICRIAQLARAVGIHMIIATQRPTTNIITGTIKANFPARMAFKVSSMVDSRTILDRPGANQLVGKGDMLFLAGSEPVRVQCAFVDTPEVTQINSHIACQQSYFGPMPLPPVPIDGDDASAPDVDMQHLDPMFEEVARLVVSTQQGSTSMIQRKFSIGYNRAGRLMDQLEVAGIVGPVHGSKPREVIVKGDIELDNLLMNMK